MYKKENCKYFSPVFPLYHSVVKMASSLSNNHSIKHKLLLYDSLPKEKVAYMSNSFILPGVRRYCAVSGEIVCSAGRCRAMAARKTLAYTKSSTLNVIQLQDFDSSTSCDSK